MSKWRPAFSAAIAVLALCWSAALSAQPPSLEDVLQRSAAYVSEFRRQLSNIVAEETYRQEISHTGRVVNAFQVNSPRTVRSDLLLIKPDDTDRYVELRDVFEVDGKPVRNRQSRLELLIRDPTALKGTSVASIIKESARYNIGGITRNINTPLMTLQFLDAANQPRFRFTHIESATPVFKDGQEAAANDAAVFRVSTEMWTVDYREHKRGTTIRTLEGRDLPAHGRFWLNPQNGHVLVSEMIVDGGGVIATVTVSYQSEPLMGFLVPIEMRETYVRYGERISGHAQYGKFRSIK